LILTLHRLISSWCSFPFCSAPDFPAIIRRLERTGNRQECVLMGSSCSLKERNECHVLSNSGGIQLERLVSGAGICKIDIFRLVWMMLWWLEGVKRNLLGVNCGAVQIPVPDTSVIDIVLSVHRTIVAASQVVG
jgi:hypothetical protein